MIAIVAAAAFFGCLAFIASQASRFVCADVTPMDDGPPPGNAPVVALVAAGTLIGGVLVATGALPLQIGIAAIVVFALVASWCSDATCGIVPDVFTLIPLGLLLLFAFAQRDWATVLSSVVVFAPFAGAAFFSKGYGMGWGDTKLAAVAGAALGAPLALIALALACAAAAIINRFSSARGSPIAFAPYIAAATGLALPLGFAH